jgi:glycosyltransferase involved in cell wall biosynthesis
MPDRITIRKHTAQYPNIQADTLMVKFDDLKQWLKQGTIIKHLFHYDEAVLFTYNTEYITKPLLSLLLIRILSRRSCFVRDESGGCHKVTWGFIGRLCGRFIRDWASKPRLIHHTKHQIKNNTKHLALGQFSKNWTLQGIPVYFRTDLYFGVRCGGSVGHISGVLNHLAEFGNPPVFFSSDTIPTVNPHIKTHIIPPENRYWDFRELPGLNYNQRFTRLVQQALRDTQVAFVYQRYGVNNFSGAELSLAWGVPFVLEYNGSETWINRNWGRPLKYNALSERIEQLNLKAADLVVVVSKPIRDELLACGVVGQKILVNPNGFDPGRYSPGVDGSSIRSRYGLGGKVVIGFIGTFGKWHGAEILAEAFGKLLTGCPEYRERVRLLMIGDGLAIREVKSIVTGYDMNEQCILTGEVPQAEGPVYLGACDILVSPQVPNPDGTEFFGSPTKIFEYMAMGKGIVASNLGQIGDILKHNQTAWLVRPGDVQSLMEGLQTLIEDPGLRKKLGAAAYRDVIAQYTWKEHVSKIVRKLEELRFV